MNDYYFVKMSSRYLFFVVFSISSGSVSTISVCMYRSSALEWSHRWAWQDEGSMCMPAFRVLKSLLTSWLQELKRTKSPLMDVLFRQIYRWLRAPHSLLHDPALHAVVHSVMRKLLIHLLSRFRTFSCEIVAASFQRIIIDTKKSSLEDAYQFVGSVTIFFLLFCYVSF